MEEDGMNLQSPIVIATIRGLYTALGMAALSWLTVYSTTNGDTKAASITAAFAFLGALGFRGGLEGIYDQGRKKESEAALLAERNSDLTWPKLTVADALIDFDKDYHFSTLDDGRHPGKYSEQCDICAGKVG